MAQQYLASVENEITEPETLCHMDYHPLNVMYEGCDVRIIDWVTAKNGKPIWDYARTYVILYEFASGLKRRFLKQITVELAVMGVLKEYHRRGVGSLLFE